MYSSSNPEADDHDKEYSEEQHIFVEDSTSSTGIPFSSDSQPYHDSSSSKAARAVFRVQARARVPWSSGLCDCLLDKKTCKNFFFLSSFASCYSYF